MPTTNEMPHPIPVAPCCRESEASCACGLSERALRGGGPFTAAQRKWCLDEIASVGHSRADHEGDSDADLGRAVLDALVDYCRDKGMM
jgi:hypothetical protein